MIKAHYHTKTYMAYKISLFMAGVIFYVQKFKHVDT